jgi:hypothetical protein
VHKYGVVWCVCYARCWFRLRLVFVLPRVTLRCLLVLCEVAPWCDLPWCGMWYVVCGMWCWCRVKLAFVIHRLACPQQKLPLHTPPLLLRRCSLTWMGTLTTCYNTKAWSSLLSSEAGRCRVSVGVVWLSCGVSLI